MELLKFKLENNKLHFFYYDKWESVKSPTIAHAILSYPGMNLSIKSQVHLLHGGELHVWAKNFSSYSLKWPNRRKWSYARRELYQNIVEKKEKKEGDKTLLTLFDYKHIFASENREWEKSIKSWAKFKEQPLAPISRPIHINEIAISPNLIKFVFNLTSEYSVHRLNKVHYPDLVNISFFMGAPSIANKDFYRSMGLRYKNLGLRLTEICKKEDVLWALEVLNQESGLVRLIISLDGRRKTLWLTPGMRDDYSLRSIDFKQ